MHFAWLYLIAILSVSSAICCDLNLPMPVPAQLASLHDDAAPRQVLLHNNVQLDAADENGVLQLSSAQSNTVLDRISQWPTLSGHIDSILAQPTVLDHDYDGLADAVYVVDRNGRLWYLPIAGGRFVAPQWLADFSLLQAEFTQPLQLVQVVTADSDGVMRRKTMLLLIAQTMQGDTLLAVQHQPARQRPLQVSDLTNRTAISNEEQQHGVSASQWQQIQQDSGWYMQLERRITALPKIYAGVVYLTSAPSPALRPDCSLAPDTNMQMHAIHLHHAGAIYARRNWSIKAVDNAKLVLQLTAQGELELSLQNTRQQQSVLRELLAISDDCANCVSQLDADQFPRLLRLATFQTENGAH
jgi:hypothetical protein